MFRHALRAEGPQRKPLEARRVEHQVTEAADEAHLRAALVHGEPFAGDGHGVVRVEQVPRTLDGRIEVVDKRLVSDVVTRPYSKR